MSALPKSAGLAALLAALCLGAPRVSLAQLGMGQPGGMGSGFGGPPSAKPKKAAPTGPETHAASGADESPVQTQEPVLPEEPNALPEELRSRLGSDAPTAQEPSAPKVDDAEVRRVWAGIVASESSPSYRFRTVFPFWSEIRRGTETTTLVPPVYWGRRGPGTGADVVFPLYWDLRAQDSRTTIVGPWVHTRSGPRPSGPTAAATPSQERSWLAPLYFQGSSGDGSAYLHIPPLLTFTQHTPRGGFDLVGPAFCSWKGGPACDARTADELSLGVAPFYFYERSPKREQELVPPLLHYYRYEDVNDATLDVWGPYVRSHSRSGDARHVAPIYWHSWGKDRDSLTILPLFHRYQDKEVQRLVTPLFYWEGGADGSRTFATPLYARHRGRTKVDMFTPLAWRYEDPDLGLERYLLFPLLMRTTSPRGSDLTLFPLFSRADRAGIGHTTWITPAFRHARDLSGWSTNLYPLLWAGRDQDRSHFVLAPIVWDFRDPESQTTVVAPLYVRHADPTSVTQLALNTYFHRERVAGGSDWEFHFFPAFAFGGTPKGSWWNVLYGLAGYQREGDEAKVKVLYIPFSVSP